MNFWDAVVLLGFFALAGYVCHLIMKDGSKKMTYRLLPYSIIEELWHTYEDFEDFARAIEQAVLQSPEIQSLRKDAARYRWLRDMIENQDLVIAKVGSWSLESWSGDDPDHYIDAAMEQQK